MCVCVCVCVCLSVKTFYKMAVSSHVTADISVQYISKLSLAQHGR
jgi:hypothetical protein